MSYKPGDFFIGIIDLLGIIAPGAVFLALHRSELMSLVGVEPPTDGAALWLGFLVASYVVGHVLNGLGVPLNQLAGRLRHNYDAFFAATIKCIPLPEGLPVTRANAFYQVLAILRTRDPSLLTEVEREMAEYKLFRGLTVGFTLHLVIVLAARPFVLPVVIMAALLLLVAAWKFISLLQWAYKSTFQLFLALADRPDGPPRVVTPQGGEPTSAVSRE